MTMNEKLTAAIDRYDIAIHKFPEGDLERVTAARNLIDTMSEAKKAETTLIEKMYVDLITAAGNVNRCADEGDTNRNHVNYGIATTCASVLRALGQEVEMPCYGEGDYLKIPKVAINGKEITYHNG